MPYVTRENIFAYISNVQAIEQGSKTTFGIIMFKEVINDQINLANFDDVIVRLYDTTGYQFKTYSKKTALGRKPLSIGSVANSDEGLIQFILESKDTINLEQGIIRAEVELVASKYVARNTVNITMPKLEIANVGPAGSGGSDANARFAGKSAFAASAYIIGSTTGDMPAEGRLNFATNDPRYATDIWVHKKDDKGYTNPRLTYVLESIMGDIQSGVYITINSIDQPHEYSIYEIMGWNDLGDFYQLDVTYRGHSTVGGSIRNYVVGTEIGIDLDAFASTGVAGVPGPTGPQGAKGDIGPAGATGEPGPEGKTGADSTVPGPTGPTGPAGATGAGLRGETGPAGPAGNDGATGATGPEGPQGVTGATGPQGPAGDAGIAYAGEFVITHGVGSSGDSALFIDGVESADLDLFKGQRYKFDISDDSMRGHEFLFSTVEYGEHNGGVEYDSGVITNGTGGTAGAFVEWLVPTSTGGLMYYYCNGPVSSDDPDHSTEGGQINLSDYGSSALRGDAGEVGATGATGPEGRAGATGAVGPTGPEGAKGSQGPTGPEGPQGPQGVTGPAGAKGDIGPSGPEGAQGVTGPAGPEGPQGVTGPAGPAGAKGDSGVTGPQGADSTVPGPTGPAGAKGDQGADSTVPGPIGPTGPAGSEGATGVTGSPGPQGPAGSTGATGPQGPQGSAGSTGATGPQGQQGIPGATGPAGATGEAGATGPQGDSGVTGPQGPAGNDGATGVTGPQGPQGDSGVTGPQGPAGSDGATGATGPQGPAGSDGATGVTGPQGPQGDSGVTGPQGPAGNDGATGATGPQGPAGSTGATGPQGPQGSAGSTGATGPQGPQGDSGVTGPQGPAGNDGATGATGPQGPAGATGTVTGGVTYAEIFEVGGAGITVGTSYQGWNTGTVGEISGMIFTPGTGTTPDTITVNGTGGGAYQLQASYTLEVHSNAIITIAVFLDGIEIPTTTTSRAFSNNSTGSFSITDLISMEAGQVLDIRLKSDTAGVLVDPVNISFNVTKLVGVGETGPAGADGVTGPQGPAGATGATGPQGADSTVAGPTGPAGPAGADGADGADGATGKEGPTGPTGPTGPAGSGGGGAGTKYLLRLEYDINEELISTNTKFVVGTGYVTTGASISSQTVGSGGAGGHTVVLNFSNEDNPPSSIIGYGWEPATGNYKVVHFDRDTRQIDYVVPKAAVSHQSTSDGGSGNSGQWAGTVMTSAGAYEIEVIVDQQALLYGNAVAGAFGNPSKLPHAYLIISF